MDVKLIAQKFAKGFVSGAGVTTLAVLQAQGCNITDLKVFVLTVGAGVVSGAFHAAFAALSTPSQ